MLVYALFALCFVTLCGVFMHFPELTYWWDATVPVPCFLLFLCFRKVTQEIFSELDEMKAEPPIFPDTRRSPKESRRGARGPPHHLVARVSPRALHPMVCGLWLPYDIAPPPIMSLRRENPKSISVFPSKVLQCRRHRRPISRDRSLCSGTLPGRGSAPRAISIASIASTAVSIDFTAISINVAISHDEEGVVLPRGRGLYR
jgi:hypothetical protein